MKGKRHTLRKGEIADAFVKKVMKHVNAVVNNNSVEALVPEPTLFIIRLWWRQAVKCIIL